jgi:hypothetical protein
MTRSCSIQGCRSVVLSRFSPYCPAHRQALGRNGHPLQTAIKVPEVAPFAKLIAKRQADNPTSEAWTILRGRWQAVAEAAAEVLAAVDAGKVYQRHEAAAARLLRGVADAAPADTVVCTAMAAVMHRCSDPRRYLSDQSALYQLARQVLRLAPSSSGRYWDHKARVSRTVRKEVPPKVLARVASILNGAFGGPAAQLYAIEQSRVPPEEVERRTLADALQGLQA